MLVARSQQLRRELERKQAECESLSEKQQQLEEACVGLQERLRVVEQGGWMHSVCTFHVFHSDLCLRRV